MLKAKPICALKSRRTNISYMASSPTHSHNHQTSHLQVRAQSFGDEGRSSNMVDANLRILKERMEQVRNNGRLERCCSRSEQGWNYASGYHNYEYKRETMLSQCFDLMGLIAGTVGLTIVTATFLLCLVSLVLHLNQ